MLGKNYLVLYVHTTAQKHFNHLISRIVCQIPPCSEEGEEEETRQSSTGKKKSIPLDNQPTYSNSKSTNNHDSDLVNSRLDNQYCNNNNSDTTETAFRSDLRHHCTVHNSRTRLDKSPIRQ